MAPSTRGRKRKNPEEENSGDGGGDVKVSKSTKDQDAPALRASARALSAKKAKEESEKIEGLDTSLGTWTESGSLLIFRHKDLQPSDKIAAFDFDSTLVCTKSGGSFAKSPTDWKPFHATLVDEKLKKLHRDGYKLVIFSNQGGIGKGHASAHSIKKRMELFIASVSVPFQVFAATEDDHYRKPSSEMWHLMLSRFNGKTDTVDLGKCFYVGDAAGRPKAWKKDAKKDHSCADRKFALNCKIAFHTPEEFFLDEPVFKGFDLGFDSLALQERTSKLKSYTAEDLGVGKKKEMVIFVGFPASGKTTFANRYFVPAGYVHVNRDTLKTPAKCLKAAREALENGKSVVIDNTSPSVDARREYIDIAKENSTSVRAFYFKVDLDLAQHMNRYRERETKGTSPHVPRVGYNIYKKKFEAPTEKEGFSEIREIEFVPDFDSKEQESRFYEYCEV